MNDCSFCSTDPDHFNEVECPVNYLGVSKQLKWFISSINTYFVVEMFNHEDYINVQVGETIFCVRLEQSYKSRDEDGLDLDIQALFNSMMGDGRLLLTTDRLSRTRFSSGEPFSILDMSYALKQTFGFYYVKEFPIESVWQNGAYEIVSKAIGYNNLTPIWYLLSNLGSPNVVNSMHDTWTQYYPSIAMKIQNSFTVNQPIQYSNSEFISVSQASSLSNLKVKLVDINLKPVKLLSPLIVTVSFIETPDEKEAEIEEAMQEIESNADFKKAVKKRMANNYKNLVENSNKVLAGVTIESDELARPIELRSNEMEEAHLAQTIEKEEVVAQQDIHEDILQ